MKSIKQQYIDLQEGKMSQQNFMRNLRMSMPQHITNVTSYTDSVRILKNKGILSEADMKGSSGKEQYSKFTEAENDNLQEITTGVKIEHECYPTKSYEEIVKLVLKNLKKDPDYYTNYKLSGIAGFKPETMGPKADIEARQMQPLDKNLGNIVDKKMGMKPVKGIEKVKASSNKAKKETNKLEKDVDLMSLVAKAVRGVQKMEATGEKMKKIVMKEGMEGQYTFNGSFKGGELEKLKAMIPDAEIDVEEDPGQTIKTTVSSKQYNDKTIGHAVNQVMGLNAPIKDKKDLGSSFDKLKAQLKEMIRQEIAGAYGGDAMDAEDGSSYINKEEQ
jgi:hypothetical protein